jgi:hypothetical protein
VDEEEWQRQPNGRCMRLERKQQRAYSWPFSH